MRSAGISADTECTGGALRMVRLGRCFSGGLIVALVLAQSVEATTFAVDDSASYVHDANTAMKWKSVAPSRRSGNLVEGATVVTVRLNVAPWASKTGKIYMALPQQSIGLVNAAWTTQGRLLPGQVISGNRTLVYAGPIRSAIIEDTITLKLEADGQRLAAAQRLQFHFEIDVD